MSAERINLRTLGGVVQVALETADAGPTARFAFLQWRPIENQGDLAEFFVASADRIAQQAAVKHQVNLFGDLCGIQRPLRIGGIGLRMDRRTQAG